MTDPTPESRPLRPAPGLKEWLFDPFTYVAGGLSLALGLAAILLAGLVGFFGNIHFDGVLDAHTGRADAIWVFLCEGMINWLSLAVTLFVLGKVVSKSAFRALDLFGTQALARWPTVVTAAAALAPPFQRYLVAVMRNPATLGAGSGAAITDAVVFGLVVFVMILMTVWMVALMYRSYRVCCNLKGATAVGTFIGGLLAAEVISKLALWPVLMR